MREEFVHYCWEFQKFNKSNLRTTKNQKVEIIHPGILNEMSGPDFEESIVIIDGIRWAGKVEIHLSSNEWYHHKHHLDAAYDQVILHVVWDFNKEITRTDGSIIPTIVLSNRVSKQLVNKHFQFFKKNQMACRSYWDEVPAITKTAMAERVLVERLNRKVNEFVFLQGIGLSWEEVIYRQIVSNFGFKGNKIAFSQLGDALPLRIVRKHFDNALQIEALVFGLAGLLQLQPRSKYEAELLNEYSYLAHLYGLKNKQIKPGVFKFSGIRPMNRPSIRLAQLSAFLSSRPNFYRLIESVFKFEDYIHFFGVPLSSFWSEHYDFDKPSRTINKGLTKLAVQNILINSVVPLKLAIDKVHGRDLLEDSIDILLSINSEDNRIISIFKKLGFKANNAADSQSLIELWNRYCIKKKCLKCQVGIKIMNGSCG